MLIMTLYGRRAWAQAFWTPDIFAHPGSLYVCYTLEIAPSNADGSQLIEPDPAAGYARVAYPIDSAHFAPAMTGELINNQQIIFPNVDSEWGMVFGIALTDDPDVGQGNVYAVGSAPEPFQPAINIQPYLDVGDIAIGLYE